MANDHSALTDELKLGKDNSDSFKVHPELNCVSSPQPNVRIPTTENFPKISVGREHANAPIVYLCQTFLVSTRGFIPHTLHDGTIR